MTSRHKHPGGEDDHVNGSLSPAPAKVPKVDDEEELSREERIARVKEYFSSKGGKNAPVPPVKPKPKPKTVQKTPSLIVTDEKMEDGSSEGTVSPDQAVPPANIELNLESLRQFSELSDLDFDAVVRQQMLDNTPQKDRAALSQCKGLQNRRLPKELAAKVPEDYQERRRAQSYSFKKKIWRKAEPRSIEEPDFGGSVRDEEMTEEERRKKILAKAGIQQSNPLAALGNILRRNSGRSPKPSKKLESPVLKPKPLKQKAPKDSPDIGRKTSEPSMSPPKSPKGFRFLRRSNSRNSGRSKKKSKLSVDGGSGDSESLDEFRSSETSSVSSFNVPPVVEREEPMEVDQPKPSVTQVQIRTPEKPSPKENGQVEEKDNFLRVKPSESPFASRRGNVSLRSTEQRKTDSILFKEVDVEPLFGRDSALFDSGELDKFLMSKEKEQTREQVLEARKREKEEEELKQREKEEELAKEKKRERERERERDRALLRGSPRQVESPSLKPKSDIRARLQMYETQYKSQRETEKKPLFTSTPVKTAEPATKKSGEGLFEGVEEEDDLFKAKTTKDEKEDKEVEEKAKTDIEKKKAQLFDHGELFQDDTKTPEDPAPAPKRELFGSPKHEAKEATTLSPTKSPPPIKERPKRVTKEPSPLSPTRSPPPTKECLSSPKHAAKEASPVISAKSPPPSGELFTSPKHAAEEPSPVISANSPPPKSPEAMETNEKERDFAPSKPLGESVETVDKPKEAIEIVDLDASPYGGLTFEERRELRRQRREQRQKLEAETKAEAEAKEKEREKTSFVDKDKEKKVRREQRQKLEAEAEAKEKEREKTSFVDKDKEKKVSLGEDSSYAVMSFEERREWRRERRERRQRMDTELQATVEAREKDKRPLFGSDRAEGGEINRRPLFGSDREKKTADHDEVDSLFAVKPPSREKSPSPAPENLKGEEINQLDKIAEDLFGEKKPESPKKDEEKESLFDEIRHSPKAGRRAWRRSPEPTEITVTEPLVDPLGALAEKTEVEKESEKREKEKETRKKDRETSNLFDEETLETEPPIDERKASTTISPEPEKSTAPEVTVAAVEEPLTPLKSEEEEKKDDAKIEVTSEKVDQENEDEPKAEELEPKTKPTEKEDSVKKAEKPETRSKVGGYRSKLDAREPKTSPRTTRTSAELVKTAADKKAKKPFKEDKKDADSRKPSWMVELQKRRKSQSQEEKAASKSPAAKTTSKQAKEDENMPEWRKRVIERRQKAEAAKSSSSRSDRLGRSSPTTSRLDRSPRADRKTTSSPLAGRGSPKTGSDLRKSSPVRRRELEKTMEGKTVERGRADKLSPSRKPDVSRVGKKPSSERSSRAEIKVTSRRSERVSDAEKKEDSSPTKSPEPSPGAEEASPPSEPKLSDSGEMTPVTPEESKQSSEEKEAEGEDEKPLPATGKDSSALGLEDDEVFVSSSEKSLVSTGEKEEEKPEGSDSQDPNDVPPYRSRSLSRSPTPTPPPGQAAPGPLKPTPKDSSVPEWKKKLIEKRRLSSGDDGGSGKGKVTTRSTGRPTASKSPSQADADLPAWKKELLAKKKTKSPDITKSLEVKPRNTRSPVGVSPRRGVGSSGTRGKKEEPDFMKEFRRKQRPSDRD